jgi:sialate O-acetylesterase
MNWTAIRWATLTLLPLCCARAAVGVEVADIFGPEMILQRERPVPVWGVAEPGEKVTVSFAGQSKTTAAGSGGRWSVKLSAMPASDQPRCLVVEGAGEPVTFENVRVGEVWLLLCHRIGKQYTCEGPVPRASLRVRGFSAGRDNHSPTPQVACGKNKAWGPDRHERFDVVSIPFANQLQEKLNVPVGVVRVEVGDLDATIPLQGFAAIPPLQDIAERIDAWYPTTRRGKQAYQQWRAQFNRWRQTIHTQMERGEPIHPSQPPLVPGPVLDDPAQPTVVFNRQLHPLVPFAFRGALHVHHESPNDDPRCTQDPRYADKMRALIAGLRAAFEHPDLAFAFTQRGQPNIYHAHTAGGNEGRNTLNFDAWHGHRDRQRRVLPYQRTGMVVTLDVENHPGRVGERFSRWALAEAYGRADVSCGPIYRSHRVLGDRVWIEFDHTGDGLMVAAIPEVGRPPTEQDGAPLRLFAVAGKDRIFHRAEAHIEDDMVVVRSDQVAQPVAVRYACHFDPRGMNLYNRGGLPASPFSTDDWPMETLDELVETFASKNPAELAAMLGYPTMLHSHAAAQALAAKGEAAVWPLVTRLIDSNQPDQRCGALRTLGYLHWMGPIPRSYYGVRPQPVTPGIERAVALIDESSKDTDPLVRRCAAEALALIGSEDDRVFRIIKRLAVDDDPLVRTAALRVSKYRFKTHAHNTDVAYALLAHQPFGDHTSAYLAGNLLNHYRLFGPIDLDAVARFLAQVGPGRGGGAVGSLGDLMRRVKMADGRPALNDPRVLPALLDLYAIGYRNYMLYGVERWISYTENVPAFREKIRQLENEIQRLKHEKPAGWQDLTRRYQDAIEGLKQLIVAAEKPY